MVSFTREQNQFFLQPNTVVRHFALADHYLLALTCRSSAGGGGGDSVYERGGDARRLA